MTKEKTLLTITIFTLPTIIALVVALFSSFIVWGWVIPSLAVFRLSTVVGAVLVTVFYFATDKDGNLPEDNQ